MTGKVYSYLRFSSVKQAAGASAVRQMEYAEKWAKDNGMTLDATLNLRDEGLSAYHQTHVKKGALGAFLKAAIDGRIPPGSILIVEGLDRLSRTDPIDAQAQLTSIINAGISVVTASDGKVYSRETLKANPMDLIYSILVMVRANEESETKSSRVSDALRRKCEGWVNGTYRGKVSCGNVPSWVTWNGTRYELIPEKAEPIRYAIRRFIEGIGGVRIIRELAEKGISITGGNRSENILQLLKQQHVFIGNRAVTVGGVDYLLEGYYPRLIDDEEYARLQVAIANSKRGTKSNGGKSEKPGLFTGIGVGFCGHCGTGLTTQNLTRTKEQRYKADNLSYRRIRCVSCTAKRAKQGLGGVFCKADPLERAILDYCSDQMNLTALFSGSEHLKALSSQQAIAAGRVATLESQQKKIVDAAFASDTALPAVLIAKLHETEAELKAAKQELETAEAAIKAASGTPDSGRAELWQELKAGVLALDYESRIKARRLVGDTFSRIAVYFGDKDALTVVLTSKTGESRTLTVDRKTGEVLHAASVFPIEENSAARVVKVRALKPSAV